MSAYLDLNKRVQKNRKEIIRLRSQVDDIVGLSSIDILADVDTTTTPPSTNNVLTWNGSQWVPQAGGGMVVGGAVTSAVDTRIFYSSGGGRLSQDANFTFDGTQFTINTTSTRFRLGTTVTNLQGLYPVPAAINYNNTTARAGLVVTDNTSSQLTDTVIQASTNSATKDEVITGMRTSAPTSINLSTGAGTIFNAQGEGIMYYARPTKVVTADDSTSRYGYIAQSYFQADGATRTFSGTYQNFRSRVQFAVEDCVVTNFYHFYVGDVLGTASGTITNEYGLYIATNDVATTNPWGVYQIDQDVHNYFNGDVRVGDNTSQGKVSIVNNTVGKIPLYVEGAVGQTADLLSVNTSAAEVLYLNSTGLDLGFGTHGHFFRSAAATLEFYVSGIRSGAAVSNWWYMDQPVLAFTNSGFHYNDSSRRGKISAESNAASDLLLHLEAHASQTGDMFRISSNGGSSGDLFLIKASGTVGLTGGHIYGTETDDGNSGTADTIDWTTSNFHLSTLTGNVTYTFTAPDGPTTLVLRMIQDGTGSHTRTFPATVRFTGGTPPTWSTGAGQEDIMIMYYDGTDYNVLATNLNIS